MKNLVILAAMLAAFSVYGQSAVRRIDSLTNLLATIDPAAVGANGTVSYLVDGYYTAGDWGSSARELTASTTSGTTNFAHLLRSPKNSSFYWRSLDADLAVQDIRWWGAKADDSVDDSVNVQAAIDYAAGTKTVFFPGGNWYFTNAITLPHDYQEFDGAGFNANIQIAHNGNGFQHLGVTNGEPRRYSVRFRNFRMTSAAGFTPTAAFHVNDCSYFLWQTVDITQGAGNGFDRALYTFGHYDTSGTNLIFGGNWGNTIRDCTWYNKAGPYYVIHGDGGPNLTGGPNDLRILDSYISGGLSGSASNGAAGAVFVQNANAIRIINNDFEQYSTNSVHLGTNVQSAIITGNRFESLGATTASRRCIKLDEYNVVGQVIQGNMMWLQGGLGSITRIAGPGDSKRISSTILDPSFEGPNQVLASTFLIGTNLDGVARDFGPMGNKTIQMDRNLATTNSIGVGVYDGTNNPRVFVILRDSEDGTGTNSRVDISAASSLASLPVYFIGSKTNATITADGSSILGPKKLGNQLTVYGSGLFGNDPSNPYIEGWTTISNLLALRSSTTNKLALWLGTIDGGDNRRVELSVDPVDKSSTLLHTYTTGGGMMKHQVGTNVIFYLTDTLLTVVTNMTITTGAGITVNGDYVNDFTGANLAVSGGILNVVGGSGSGLDADLLDGQSGAYYLDRANHTGTQSYTTITGLGGMALIDDAISDGNIYGRKNGAWTIVTNSGGGGGSTNGTSFSVDGAYQTAVNVTNSSKIDPTLSGTNLTFTIVPNSLQTNDIDSTFRAFITNQAGTTYTFSTGTTNSGGVISVALAPGGNITFTTNANTITIAASTGSTNSGTPLAVDGTLLVQANLADNAQVNPTASGTNVTFSIVPNSLTTNEISSAFFNWIDSQGGGGGDVYAASNNVFTATNTFTGPVTGGVFSVTTIVLANPIGVTAVGTNVADAQDELQLTPGVYTMAYDLDLQQLATITWSNGVMAYHNGSTITNLVSTSTGRSLLTASSVTNGRDVLEVGQLDQSAYGAGWDGVTNATPTLNALYDKIQSLPGGSNNISSWNTNYFSVTGGYLDWVGGSTGGGGVTWIGTSGLGGYTNLTTATNVTLGYWTISSNDVPSAVGRYLVGESAFYLTNNSGGTVNFHLSAKVNGVPVLSSQRSFNTATQADWQVARFRLSRETDTNATLYFDSERYQSINGLQIGSGGGGFSSSGGGIIVITNVPITWTTNFTFSLDMGQIAITSITNDWAGTKPIAASLYNPGSGSSGGSSGTNTVFTVNGVTFDPVIITNSATVTWATNANGHIQATAAGGSVTNSAMVVGSAVFVANPNAGTGNEVSNLVVRGIVSSVAWNLNVGIPATYDEYNVTFTQNLGTNYSIAVIAEGQAASIYPYCGIKSSTVTTSGFTLWRQKDADTPSLSDGERIRVTVFSDSLSSTNLIVSTISASNIVLNGSDLAGLLAAKQPASAVLTNVSALTSGTSTNFLAGDGTFKQVTTNMIPGLNAALASAGGGSVKSFVDGSPITNLNLRSSWANKASVSSVTNVDWIPQPPTTASSTSLTPAFNSSRGHEFTLTGNATLNAPSGVTSDMVGDTFRLVFIQDATGNRTLTTATNYLFGSDITGLTLTTNAGARDYAVVYVRRTNVFDVVGFVRGYAQ